MLPACAGDGIHFTRRPGQPIPAHLSSVRSSIRCTTLQGAGGPIHTVEHLLAALHGLGIWDAEIQLQGDEIPALDGSAAPFVRALMVASRQVDQGVSRGWRVARSFSRRAGLASCHLQPFDGCRLECGIWFPHPAIRRQRVVFQWDPEVFASRIAPARTFGMVQDRQWLRSRALARGATLRNVVVFDENRTLTPGGLRFSDEPARHKLLDALGDLALLGGPLKGRVKLERCGHQLLQDALRAAMQEGAIVPEAGRCGDCHSGAPAHIARCPG